MGTIKFEVLIEEKTLRLKGLSHKMEWKDDLFFAKKGQLFKKCFFLHAFMV